MFLKASFRRWKVNHFFLTRYGRSFEVMPLLCYALPVMGWKIECFTALFSTTRNKRGRKSKRKGGVNSVYSIKILHAQRRGCWRIGGSKDPISQTDRCVLMYRLPWKGVINFLLLPSSCRSIGKYFRNRAISKIGIRKGSDVNIKNGRKSVFIL